MGFQIFYDITFFLVLKVVVIYSVILYFGICQLNLKISINDSFYDAIGKHFVFL